MKVVGSQGRRVARAQGYKVARAQGRKGADDSSTMLNYPPFVLSLSKDSRFTLRQAQRERNENAVIIEI
jgi:hypothetical protein